MRDVFVHLANLSITASYLILAVFALRLILRKIPKNLFLWLWALVGLRLAIPFSLESALSLIPKSEPIPENIALAPAPAIDSGIPVIDRTINPVITENLSPAVTASVNPLQVILAVISVVWLVGLAAMLLYAAIGYLRLSRQVRVSIHLEGNLYLCDEIAAPFILGILKPKIYLPSDMKPEYQVYVLNHEHAHLRHHDPLWKPLGFLLLAVYWFNPLVWIAYLLFCRDLEMACDERAIMGLGDEEKKAYSYALLACAAPRRAMTVCPIAFGENSVKSRIQNVLRFKKASVWVAAAVLVITAAAAVCFLTNPKEEERSWAQPVPEGEVYQPLDGAYSYTNGRLHLEIQKVSGVTTRMVQDAQGEEYEQTILLAQPGTVVTVVDPDIREGREAWQLCTASVAQDGKKSWRMNVTSAALLPTIPLTDGEEFGNLVLGNNDYYIEDVDSASRRVLLLLRKAEDLDSYVPATAADAIVCDLTTGDVLYSYRRTAKAPPGDLNKLALALVVLEDHSPEELVDTTSLPEYLKDGASYRTSFPFMKPELSLERMQEMTVEDLLTLMLIRGSDDAAYALARFDAGSEEAMAARMNDYVKSACPDTHYTDLYGYAEGQYTTGADTLLLVKRMMENPCLSRIWSVREYTFHFPDGGEEYTVSTTNYLLDDSTIPEFYDLRVTGGFALGTENLICTARQDGKEVLCILLGAERKFKENGWQVEYYGNFEETCQLLNAVFG